MTNQNKIQKKSLFLISNLYIGAFFYAKGFQLVNIERTSNHRCKFIFKNSPQREKLFEAFNFASKDDPEVLIDVRDYINAVKMLKDRIYAEEP